MRRLNIYCEPFELKRPFSISTGTIECITALRVAIEENGFEGQGEAVPSAANMVTKSQGLAMAAAAREEVEAIRQELESGADRVQLQRLMPRGPARNAVDCALWDLELKTGKVDLAKELGVSLPEKIVTGGTVSLAGAERMRQQALALNHRRLIKVKLGGGDDVAAISAVRDAAPDATLIVDVNGGWSLDQVEPMAVALEKLGVAMIEQPVAAGEDGGLADIAACLPLCADESCHDSADLDYVQPRYDFVNIKLDKTGGLTEAIRLAQLARQSGLELMVGCMAGTSLSMAPAAAIGAVCKFVDLDGPLLLKTDREGGLKYEGDYLHLAKPEFWGGHEYSG